MKDVSLEKIFREIRDRRKARKISQADIAEELGITKRTYLKYEAVADPEKGDDKKVTIPAEVLLKLCFHFEIDINEFLLSGQVVDLVKEVDLVEMKKQLDRIEKNQEVMTKSFTKLVEKQGRQLPENTDSEQSEEE